MPEEWSDDENYTGGEDYIADMSSEAGKAAREREAGGDHVSRDADGEGWG